MQIAEKLGRLLKGRAVIELRSDVGGGKTTFVRGLAKGMGSDDQVSSPTFTISKHYRAGEKNLTMHHFDFYRLEDPGLMQSELGESLADNDIVTVVEWAGAVKDVMPDDRLVIDIFATGEYTRLIGIEAGPDHTYLIDGMNSWN